jgi:hypothetical protein
MLRQSISDKIFLIAIVFPPYDYLAYCNVGSHNTTGGECRAQKDAGCGWVRRFRAYSKWLEQATNPHIAGGAIRLFGFEALEEPKESQKRASSMAIGAFVFCFPFGGRYRPRRVGLAPDP